MSYRRIVVAFVLFFALALLTLVDFRRGFLFPAYAFRNAFLAFHPCHIVMLAAGIAGMAMCWRRLRAEERADPAATHDVKPLTFVLMTLLVADLFTYRGVPAARSLASGRIGVDWLNAFGVTTWWVPVAQATSYLANVWHATLLGVLVSGLALTIFPVYFSGYFARSGFGGSLAGALFALPQPFCSCCSSVMAPSFARRGASTNFLLAFVVGAPMLNVTTIVLALALLPAPFAIVRILAGVVVAVVVTYLVALLDRRTDPVGRRSGDQAALPCTSPTPPTVKLRLSGRIVALYDRLLDIDAITRRGVNTPARMLATWLYASSRIALVLVPTLWVWSVLAAAVFRVLPPAFGNNLPSVVVSAVAGTFFMISTWSEIPMALQLIHGGLSGPAAALLVVLPAVSLPCMVLLGGALERFRTVMLLAAAVMVVGIVAGALFL